jgi:hypothetical protein
MLTNEERTQSRSEFQDKSTTLQINDQMEYAGLNMQNSCRNQFNMIEDMSQQQGEQKRGRICRLGTFAKTCIRRESSPLL